MRNGSNSYLVTIAGVAAAIAITTTMDANGLTAFSALPLCPLMGIFWYLERFSRQDVGFSWGARRAYSLAVLYPVVVLGAIALIAWLAGQVNVTGTDWAKAGANAALITISTVLVVIVTEEGFFRGWLWASLRRRGQSPVRTLIWTSAAFSLWHLSAVALETGFDLPGRQIPQFLVNVFVMGAVLGVLRMSSGSVLVSSVSHGIWNGMDYPMFGFGTKVGALGIGHTSLYGPEVGLIGLACNVAFLSMLWTLERSRLAPRSASS